MAFVQTVKPSPLQAGASTVTAILIADNADWTDEIKLILESVGLQVRELNRIAGSLDVASRETVHLLVVASTDCSSITRHLRALRNFQDTPLFAFVQNEQDILSVLDAGADDAALVSDSPEILAARFRAILRRERRREKRNGVITIRDLRVDLDKFQVTLQGRSIALTPTEFRIVAYLAQRAGRVVNSASLLRAASGISSDEKDAQNVIKVHIANIRRKLDSNDQPYILSVRGFGYMLERRRALRDDDPLRAFMEPSSPE